MAVCYFAETKIFKLNKKKSGKKKSSEIKKKGLKKTEITQLIINAIK